MTFGQPSFSSSVSSISTIHVGCAVKFLENVGKLYQAFSVHQKHKRAHILTLQEAGEIMKSVSGCLQGTVQSVQTLLGNSHFKHPTCMQLHYARDFETATLESAKRMTQWSIF